MKLILLSNILEHADFPKFLAEVSKQEPQALFVVTGDLLNVFPEPGEDLKGSIFYELYGDMMLSGMDELIANRFKNVKESPLVEPLFHMFSPMGQNYEKAKAIACDRYKQFFDQVRWLLKDTGRLRFLYIPGNMDYPFLSAIEVADDPRFIQLDHEAVLIDGVCVGGLGGIPNTAHPFRQIAEISPYEMHEAEYERRLSSLSGVRVLLTHLSPSESPALKQFLRTTPVELLICRAPFDFNRDQDFRGELCTYEEEGKSVICVRPFEGPENTYYEVELGHEKREVRKRTSLFK